MPRSTLLIPGLLLASGATLSAAQALFAPAPGSPFAVGNEPLDLAVGDVNGDGKLDVVTANSGTNDVSVLLGDGRGHFRPAPGAPFDAGPRPHLLVLADFNRDGKLDVAVTAHDSNDVRVFLGGGDGRFAASPGSPFRALSRTPPHNHGLAAGDVNGDGAPDVTTSNQNDRSASVLLGNGRGQFQAAPGSPFPVGGAPYLHALGDMNGDGTLDLVLPNLVGDSVALLVSVGKGGFAPAAGSPHPVAHRPYFAAVADLDGNGGLDVVVTHDDIGQVTVLLGDGRGGLRPSPASPVEAGHRGWKIAFGDVNRDGKLDMVTPAWSDSAAVVLLGDGRGGFTLPPDSLYPVGRAPSGIALADVNGDAKPDLLTADSEGNSVTVLLAR